MTYQLRARANPLFSGRIGLAMPRVDTEVQPVPGTGM